MARYKEDDRRRVFDLEIGDRFFYKCAAVPNGTGVEVISPWDYKGIAYGFDRILVDCHRLNPLAVYVADIHDRSRIYEIRENLPIDYVY